LKKARVEQGLSQTPARTKNLSKQNLTAAQIGIHGLQGFFRNNKKTFYFSISLYFFILQNTPATPATYV
jgi:hypothetical protein